MNQTIDINRLNMNGLVEYHNQLNPENQVKRFKNISIGRQKIQLVLEGDTVNLSDYKRKKEKMNTQPDPKTDESKPVKAKPAAEIPPESKIKQKKFRSTRIPADMLDPNTSLDQANNRKEIVQWHAHNPSGLLKTWDTAVDGWLARAAGRLLEEAPAKKERDYIERFGSVKAWPKTPEMNAALNGVKKSLGALSK